MAHQSHLNSEKYRQWVKAGLGLLYLKEGLAPFCDDVAKQQHRDILDNIKRTKNIPTVLCGTCTLKTLQPDHVKTGKKQCPLSQTNCNCCYTAGKTPCPNKVCGAIYDIIIKYHASTPPAPNWKNTQTQQWIADPWSIAKCFINAPGYEQKTSAADTDCTGLLHVIINNMYCHNHVSCNMTGHNIFSKVRQYRNEIFHSNTMELDSSTTNSYIDDMIAVLQDCKELIHRKDAKDAVKKLQDLKKEAFIITTEDISLIMRTSEGLAKDNEDQKRKLANLESIITELKEDTSAKKKREYDSSKAALQENLIKGYRQNILPMPAMPCEPKHTRNFKDVYVTPKITIKSKDKDEKKNIETEVNKMSDIFNKDNQCFESIYILGEAVSGKSSFCKRLVNCWCMAHSDTQDLDGQQADEKTDNNDELIKVMTGFDFLFFIPLHLYTDKVSIEDMLENVYRHRVFKEFLENESEKCLIVLDGLDEWTHNRTFPPQRTLCRNYTVLTTSRPWKIGSLNMSDKEMQHIFHINGFGFESKNKMITKTVNILNKTFKKDKDPQNCEDAIKNHSLNSLTHTAMMLQQLICLWFDDKLLATSKCNLYTSMLDLFFVWYKKKVPGAPLFNEFLNKSQGFKLPELFNDTDECKLHSYIIQGVSRLAYETLIKNEKEISLIFDSSMLKKLNISNDIKDCCLELGILSEEKGPSLFASRSHKSHMSFIHKSVQEYLAAVYIVSNLNTELEIEGADLSDYLSKMLNVKTVDEVLENENVLIMLCGAEPRMGESISKFIHDIVAKDERVVKYRTTIDDRDIKVSQIIHNSTKLSVDCLEETKASHQLQECTLYLGDLIFFQLIQHLQYVKGVTGQNITFDSVLSICISSSMFEEEEYGGIILECMTKCKNLEAIKFEWDYDKEIYQRLSDSIESNISTLKCLSIQNHSSTDHSCRPPFRRIANMTHLVALQIEWLTVTHEDFTLLCTFLSETGNLQQISIFINCKCYRKHEVDLSKHKLQCLMYGWSLVVKKAVFTNLEVIKCFSLNEINCILDLLSNSMKLKEICFDCGMAPDVRKLSRQIDFHTTLTRKLTHVISLSNQLRVLHLTGFTLTDNIFTCPFEMKSLESIDVACGTMSFTTWQKFVDSIAEIPQRVKVKASYMCITRDREECNPDIHWMTGGGKEADALQYVRERDALFDVYKYEHSLQFSTKK